METPENKQVNLKYSKDFMILALLVGLVMLTAHVYDMAPALIPTHFGLNLSSPMGYGPKSSLLVVAVIGICFGLAGVAAGHSKNLPIRINGLSMHKMNEVQKEALRQLVYRFTVCIILLCACVVMLACACCFAACGSHSTVYSAVCLAFIQCCERLFQDTENALKRQVLFYYALCLIRI